jgi:SAM-dependent methyltransferase
VPHDYKAVVKNALMDEQAFHKMTLKGHIEENRLPWRQVIVRPVLIKQVRYLQFSYFDAKQDITKNYQGQEAQAKLDELLALPFHAIFVQTTNGNITVQIAKTGKATITRSATTVDAQVQQESLAHDRKKQLALPAGKADTFLQEIGIMNAQGQVLPSMQDKFAQINEFLKLLEHTGELERFKDTKQVEQPVQILDCGCGSAYLSFAVYHYLNDIKGIAAALAGIDVNGTLVDKNTLHSNALRLSHMCFQQSAIINYVPAVPPDIVLALHACDTATDEALVQGILTNARLILCVPCCHHDLHRQLQAVAPFQPVFQHGILKKRFADILTDTFRAEILRLMGYKTDVIEFISPEHTDRNIMLRAVKRTAPGDTQTLQAYNALKTFWNVTPYSETLLRERGKWVS